MFTPENLCVGMAGRGVLARYVGVFLCSSFKTMEHIRGKLGSFVHCCWKEVKGRYLTSCHLTAPAAKAEVHFLSKLQVVLLAD